MQRGSSRVLILFALAVAGALAGIAWLALSPAPVAAPPVVEGPPKKGDTTPRVDHRDPSTNSTGNGKGTERTPRTPRDPSVPLVIKGVVHTAAGVPAPGAKVVVRDGTRSAGLELKPAPADKAIPWEILRDLFYLDFEEKDVAQPYDGLPRARIQNAGQEVVAEGAAGEDGTFSLTVPGTGPWRVEASLSGATASRDGIRVPGMQMLLTLSTGATLRGTVIDADTRAPVAGAAVQAVAAAVAMRVSAKEDGSYAFPDLPAGRYTVTAGAPGYALESVGNVEAGADAPPREISLDRGFSARVTVSRRDPLAPPPPRNTTGPAGPPLEGARVILFLRGEEVYVTDITGPDGTVRFEGLCEGRWRVAVQKDGFSTGVGREIRFLAANRQEAVRDVAIMPLVETPIRVIDATGAPVAAKLYWSGDEDNFDVRYSEAFGATGPDGRGTITFDEMVDRKAIAWVVPEGGLGAVAVEADDPYSGEEITVVVRPGRVARGRVTDPNGNPVPGAAVSLEVTNDRLDVDLYFRTYTDAQGNYAFMPVPFGETYLEVDTDWDWVDEDIDEDNKDDPLVRNFTVEVDDEMEEVADPVDEPGGK